MSTNIAITTTEQIHSFSAADAPYILINARHDTQHMTIIFVYIFFPLVHKCMHLAKPTVNFMGVTVGMLQVRTAHPFLVVEANLTNIHTLSLLKIVKRCVHDHHIINLATCRTNNCS